MTATDREDMIATTETAVVTMAELCAPHAATEEEPCECGFEPEIEKRSCASCERVYAALVSAPSYLCSGCMR